MKIDYVLVVQEITKTIIEHPESSLALTELLSRLSERVKTIPVKGGRKEKYPWDMVNFALSPSELSRIWGVPQSLIHYHRHKHVTAGTLPTILTAGTKYNTAVQVEKAKVAAFKRTPQEIQV